MNEEWYTEEELQKYGSHMFNWGVGTGIFATLFVLISCIILGLYLNY